MMRLQKYLALSGVASRRTSEKLIAEGHVMVNGRKITEMGVQIDENHDRVFVDGRVCRQGSRELTPGALVSVRGYGRLRLLADAGFTRKGNHKLQVAITK